MINSLFEELSPALFMEPVHIKSLIVADFDNDGKEEVFINTYKNRNHMFRYLGNREWEELEIDSFSKLFIGNKNHWLIIQPLTKNGLPALGAKVRIHLKNGKSQLKFISSGSHYLSQIEPVAHFGLGSTAPDIQKIEVTWPANGVDLPPFREILGTQIAYNTFIQIPYPND